MLSIFQLSILENQIPVIEIYLVGYLCPLLLVSFPLSGSERHLVPIYKSRFFKLSPRALKFLVVPFFFNLSTPYMFKVTSLNRGTVSTMTSIPDAAPQPTRNEKDILTAVPISPTPFQEKPKFSTPGRRTGSIITIIESACANLSDGFQQGLASSTNIIFNHLMGTKVYTSALQTRMSNSLLVGSVIGILVFGYLADRFSRKGGSKFVLCCSKVNDR